MCIHWSSQWYLMLFGFQSLVANKSKFYSVSISNHWPSNPFCGVGIDVNLHVLPRESSNNTVTQDLHNDRPDHNCVCVCSAAVSCCRHHSAVPLKWMWLWISVGFEWLHLDKCTKNCIHFTTKGDWVNRSALKCASLFNVLMSIKVIVLESCISTWAR